ncbi:LuxR C-terminal-related transcriptional regulator [Microbulbifer bruguierae]|uniref:LuxR C-terminal-related transcriptional regulator n=1 Tax=Microbulbifer bruguierae TaxID=3029061 RepID=A0ABY8N9D5_9GAMM|nr:LuxR C-terminal-related transcriptional regulator [Microbulbifer bruguierae]WGL15095.1 LuxR C-terminal-related transcriptional regulator [Microbulbifer bruguierae]
MINGREEQANWHKTLGQLVTALGSDLFYRQLLETIHSRVPVDYPQIWLYHREQRPSALYYDLPPGDEPNQIDRYIAGSYRLDPFYLTAFEAGEPGVYRLTEIAAQRFEQSDYYKSYYALLKATDEIVFIADINPDSSLQVCLMRGDTAGRFTDRELEFLRLAEPVITPLLRQHLKLSPPPPAAPPGMEKSVERAFGLFGQSMLTGRERDVLGLILQGYNSRVAAERLGISAETLRRHRKNIYRKLDISSQNELFSLFLSSLHCLDHTPNVDPLFTYMNMQADS